MTYASFLPVPASMETATAMKATAAVDCTAMESAANGATPDNRRSASNKAAPNEAGASIESRPAIEAATPVAVAPSMEPRAGADEHAAHEPIRSVVAIGGAGIRIIPVIAVGANRRGANIGRTHAYSNDHSLRIRKRSEKQANPE